MYWPESPRSEVGFRLELSLGERRLTRSAMASPLPLPEPPAPPPPMVTFTAAVPPRNESSIRHYTARTVRPPVENPPPIPAQPVAEPPRPSPFETKERVTGGSADRAAMPPAPLPAPPPRSIPRESAGGVSVTAEPMTPSRTGVVGRIPVLRRLHKTPGRAVAARAVREVRPSILAAQRGMAMPVGVDVRVDVDQSGRVSEASTSMDVARRHREFANAAVNAARQWRFEPARIGDEEVPGRVILHFRFTPVAR